MAPPHPRVVNAFHAMRDLGITEEKVKPILKKLLKLYDKNWDPIEDENYRVLIDAIFESEEPQASISSKKRGNSEAPTASPKKEIVEEETELPLKRHRSKFQDHVSCVDESSTFSAGGSQRIPYDEPIDCPESFHPAVIYSDKPNGKGGERFPQEENGAGPSDIKKTIDDYPESFPLAVIYPDKPNGKGVERFPQEENGAGPSVTSSHGFSCQLVASSSPRGEVKMFLNCNASQVSAGFRMPIVEDVLQLVEDRCRERYNIQDPSFSIKKIMEDMGKGVLDLGSES